MSWRISDPTVTLEPPTQTAPKIGEKADLRVRIDYPLAPGVAIRAHVVIRGAIYDPEVFAGHAIGWEMAGFEIEERRLLTEGLGDEVWKGNEQVDHELERAAENWLIEKDGGLK